MSRPTKKELLKIAEESLAVELSDYHNANVEVTAQAIVDGDSSGGLGKNLASIKMLLLTAHRAKEIASKQT